MTYPFQTFPQIQLVPCLRVLALLSIISPYLPFSSIFYFRSKFNNKIQINLYPWKSFHNETLFLNSHIPIIPTNFVHLFTRKNISCRKEYRFGSMRHSCLAFSEFRHEKICLQPSFSRLRHKRPQMPRLFLSSPILDSHAFPSIPKLSDISLPTLGAIKYYCKPHLFYNHNSYW